MCDTELMDEVNGIIDMAVSALRDEELVLRGVPSNWDEKQGGTGMVGRRETHYVFVVAHRLRSNGYRVTIDDGYDDGEIPSRGFYKFRCDLSVELRTHTDKWLALEFKGTTEQVVGKQLKKVATDIHKLDQVRIVDGNLPHGVFVIGFENSDGPILENAYMEFAKYIEIDKWPVKRVESFTIHTGRVSYDRCVVGCWVRLQ